MANKYTIIDNFDKLDATFVEVGRQTPSSQIAEELKPNYYNETVSPPTNDSGKIKNYNMIYNFSTDMQYIPDMLRFITGYRFFINKSDNSIKYPNATLIDSQEPDFPADLWIKAKSLAGMPIWFDFRKIQGQFTDNSVVFANSLQFRHYYEPQISQNVSQGTVTTPSWLKSDWTFQTVSQTMSDLANGGGGWSEKVKDKNDNWLYLNNILFNAGKHDGGNTAKYENLGYFVHPLPNHYDGWMMEENISEPGWPSIFRDILQKLLLFEKIWTAGGAVGAFGTPPGGMVKHLYLVADLPKGTNEKTKEFEYTVNTDYVDIESTYNYFADYSENFSENVISELQLPNLYTYYNLQTKKSSYYKDLVKLGQDDNTPIDKLTLKKYYQLANTSNLPSLPERQSNIGVPQDIYLPMPYRNKTIIFGDRHYLNDANSISAGFPMYNKITITSKESDFMKLIRENELTDKFLSFLGNYFSTVGKPESSAHRFLLHNGEYAEDIKTSSTLLQVLDLTTFFASGAGLGAPTMYEKYFYDDKNVKIGEPTMPPTAIGGYMSSNGLNSALFAAMAPAAQEYFEKHKIEFHQHWHKGEKCHTEVVAYEIAKYRLDDMQGKKYIQSIFIPSSQFGTDASYIDTQIFYDQEYVYEIFTHSLVIGTKYRFNRQVDLSGLTEGQIGFDKNLYHEKQVPAYSHADGIAKYITLPRLANSNVDDESIPHEPIALIVRAPYYNNRSLISSAQEQKSTLVLDKPPLPPEIVFHPYKDDDEKILILLNVQYGERHLSPIVMNALDKVEVQKQVLAQLNINKPPGTLLYKTDDVGGDFLIYKTTTKPQDLKDGFDEASVTIVKSGEKTGYNDAIFPNVDYYYTARYRDVHGNLSNPTEVFYVRIVKEGGFPPYLVTHSIDMRGWKKKEYVYEKTFKKYLKIRLPDKNRVLTNEDEGIHSVGVGYSKSNGTQLKKYKVRITSLKTGKKMDINLDFNQIKNSAFLSKAYVPLPDRPDPLPYSPEGVYIANTTEQPSLDDNNAPLPKQLGGNMFD